MTACTENKACDLPNVQCAFPDCTKGRADLALRSLSAPADFRAGVEAAAKVIEKVRVPDDPYAPYLVKATRGIRALLPPSEWERDGFDAPDISDSEWANDKPLTVENAIGMLRFGAVLNEVTNPAISDVIRTERRMVACADVLERALRARPAEPPAAAGSVPAVLKGQWHWLDNILMNDDTSFDVRLTVTGEFPDSRFRATFMQRLTNQLNGAFPEPSASPAPAAQDEKGAEG